MATKIKEETFSNEIEENIVETTPVAETPAPIETRVSMEIIPEEMPKETPVKTSGQTVQVVSIGETELVVANDLQQGFIIKKEKAHKNVKVGDYIII